MTSVARDVAAVVVDYHTGDLLAGCVDSLVANDVESIVVVENGEPGSAPRDLGHPGVRVLEVEGNLGYGRGVNRGAAGVGAAPYLLVSNPDVVVHEGAVSALVDFLETHPTVGVVGPQIVRPDGSLYPSARVFPNPWLAAAHALVGPWWPTNPATRRYRSPHPDGSADWVSGAFFLVRRAAFEEVGGFDERYFMFAEDMALCWSLRRAGWDVATTPDAVVTHVEGAARARAPRAMLVAHHRSALRFEAQTATGLRRALVPLAALVLGLRLIVVLARSRSAPGA